jgi:hypothetical protein
MSIQNGGSTGQNSKSGIAIGKNHVFAFCVVLQLPIPFYHIIWERTNWCEGFG